MSLYFKNMVTTRYRNDGYHEILGLVMEKGEQINSRLMSDWASLPAGGTLELYRAPYKHYELQHHDFYQL